jgi:hypothetical protein
MAKGKKKNRIGIFTSKTLIRMAGGIYDFLNFDKATIKIA